ncbi:GNAT family N-acetyltransferase [Aestuariivirga sp.]|uniref:GNAT family N-acetyltransferase n=1 Tax=Aestuariivirga sp. TaxID=2650926 RepID=UPI0025BE8B6D|nr:GNAT family N-acetyltransferase [Aestuariivirga sp.]MCA3555126.1 GNAT family N-acetyltransferase [Aestuariivirga sp.]
MPTGATRLRERLTIRDYRDGDEAAVLAVLRDLQAHELQIYDRARPPETMGNWYIDLLKQAAADGRGRILVAEGEDGVLGYAAMLTRVSAEHERDEIPYTYAYVDDLGVRAAARSRGVGAALLDACETIAREAGQGWIRLGVLAGNQRARSFYGRQGYGEMLLTLEKKL